LRIVETTRVQDKSLPVSPTDAAIGQSYQVPCVRIVEDTVFPNEFLKTGELVPVLLPAHEDAEYFDFPYLHFHVDFRFAGNDLWGRMRECTAHVHSCIVTLSLSAGEPQMQSLVCLREMPQFPTAAEIQTNNADTMYDGLVSAVCGLERAHQSSRINIDTLICPHRGVCLKGLPVTDDTVVCPAHGLAWNIVTGTLAIRHDRAFILPAVPSR
jgi:hypothetical protein